MVKKGAKMASKTKQEWGKDDQKLGKVRTTSQEERGMGRKKRDEARREGLSQIESWSGGGAALGSGSAQGSWFARVASPISRARVVRLLSTSARKSRAVPRGRP